MGVGNALLDRRMRLFGGRQVPSEPTFRCGVVAEQHVCVSEIHVPVERAGPRFAVLVEEMYGFLGRMQRFRIAAGAKQDLATVVQRRRQAEPVTDPSTDRNGVVDVFKGLIPAAGSEMARREIVARQTNDVVVSRLLRRK